MNTRFSPPARRPVALFASLLALIATQALIASPSQSAPQTPQAASFDTPEALGEALFFDPNLSANRSQSCSSCHDPDTGFTDPRQTEQAGGAVSLGDDGVSLGDRNAPTAAYAAFSPEFHQRADGVYVGGQFLDGREDDLAGQAGGPPLNPLEMGMADKTAVAARLAENPGYVAALEHLFGLDSSSAPEATYAAMTQSIAAFEKTEAFAPFSSKYDRYLRGEATLTDEEELGRVLFFSQQFTNCNQCHQLARGPMDPKETFSNYEYHNIGVPANPDILRTHGADHVDQGLLSNPAVEDPGEAGKFKVPTLRNVAVTGPYMHNGVFKDLHTVVRFYNKYNSRAEKNKINPETGAPWGPPEVDGTLALKQLEDGSPLDDQRIDAVVAFLKTLTDARYEPLLQQ